MVTCHWKSTFGVSCPGCGFQRSIDLLFQGEFWESFLRFPATLALLITALLTIIHLIYKLRRGPRMIVFSFAISVGLMAFNFIKNIIESTL